MGKFTDQWKQKSGRTLGNQRGRGLFIRMLSEQDKLLAKAMLRKRTPRPDNSASKDSLDLL